MREASARQARLFFVFFPCVTPRFLPGKEYPASNSVFVILFSSICFHSFSELSAFSVCMSAHISASGTSNAACNARQNSGAPSLRPVSIPVYLARVHPIRAAKSACDNPLRALKALSFKRFCISSPLFYADSVGRFAPLVFPLYTISAHMSSVLFHFGAMHQVNGNFCICCI